MVSASCFPVSLSKGSLWDFNPTFLVVVVHVTGVVPVQRQRRAAFVRDLKPESDPFVARPTLTQLVVEIMAGWNGRGKGALPVFEGVRGKDSGGLRDELWSPANERREGMRKKDLDY